MMAKQLAELQSPPLAFTDLANDALALCEALGAISDEPGMITRTYLSEATRRAHEVLREAMARAGLKVRVDAAGNMIGRREGETVNAKRLLTGSHIDTVRNAGKFDGVLGVALGVALARALGERTLPFAIDVIAFSEEEGVRYRRPYLGSAALAGQFDPAWLELVDSDGVSVSDAIRAFGLDPGAIGEAAYARDAVLGYLEAHIEQGPQLEARSFPLGVVSGISGQCRFRVKFEGKAGHAGTVPMAARRDALAGAAAFIGAVESYARETPELVATVGWMRVEPNTPNVIPAIAKLSVDVRHLSDATREKAVREIQRAAEEIATRRGLQLSIEPGHHDGSTPCDPAMVRMLSEAVGQMGIAPFQLPSGAGHDAVVMAKLCPIAMLFVRCKDGISHHPAESVARDDVAAALRAMWNFVHLMEQRTRQGSHDASRK